MSERPTITVPDLPWLDPNRPACELCGKKYRGGENKKHPEKEYEIYLCAHCLEQTEALAEHLDGLFGPLELAFSVALWHQLERVRK